MARFLATITTILLTAALGYIYYITEQHTEELAQAKFEQEALVMAALDAPPQDIRVGVIIKDAPDLDMKKGDVIVLIDGKYSYPFPGMCLAITPGFNGNI